MGENCEVNVERFDLALAAALPGLDGSRAGKFRRYYELLVEWNARMNLTAITAPDEVAQKHFADSVLPADLIPEGALVIDVGTGAGFPGVPLLIMRPDIRLTLLDSLEKRLTFLAALLPELGLEARLVHARAEDGAHDGELREKFDIALARAVAPAPVLAEYTVPYLKKGGLSLMYKGAKAEEELDSAKGAFTKLACEAQLMRYDAAWGERCVIAAKKLAPTAPCYPRKVSAIQKKTL